MLRKFIAGLTGLVVFAPICFAVATNLYTVPRTTYTTAETTITFPWRTQAITVVNFDDADSLMISYQGRTIEADPTVNPIIELNDVQFYSINLRFKTNTGEAHVISLH